jgi:hypothetical protein
VIVLALAAMGLAPSDAGATGTQGPIDYVVRTDAALRRMQVDVCFRGGPALVLVPGAMEAGVALIDAHDDAGRALTVRNGRIELAGLGPGRCVRYRLDLDAAMAAVRFSDRHGVDLLTSAGAWLWRPARLGSGPATLRFELPAGIHAATPWPRVGGVHRLPRTRPSRLRSPRSPTPPTSSRLGTRVGANVANVKRVGVRAGGGSARTDASRPSCGCPLLPDDSGRTKPSGRSGPDPERSGTGRPEPGPERPEPASIREKKCQPFALSHRKREARAASRRAGGHDAKGPPSTSTSTARGTDGVSSHESASEPESESESPSRDLMNRLTSTSTITGRAR